MPERREKVKVVFKNGTLVEGIVLEWDKKYGSIFTKAGHVIEIFNIPDNVLFVKSVDPMLDRDPELEEYGPMPPDEEKMTIQIVEEEMHDVHEQDSISRAVAVAESRMDQSRHLRELVATHLKSRTIPHSIEENYESPDFTKSSAFKHPPT